MFTLTLLWIAHGVVLLAGSALLQGWIKLLKAKLQSRRGPGLLQPVRDLHKWFRKETIRPEDASWLFLAAPYLCFVFVLSAGLMLPIVTWRTPFGFTGDTLVFLYLLAAARFITVLAAVDSSSSFTGMGTSRELASSIVVEPAVLLTLLPSILTAGSSRLDVITATGAADGIMTATILAACAFLLVFLAETGRIPVDNPDTHLELTMIHEGMMLEYSGRSLALMNAALWMKQGIWTLLGAHLFLPDIGWMPLWAELLLSAAFIGAILAAIETSNAKMRLYRIPRYIGTSVLLSVMALGVYFVQ